MATPITVPRLGWAMEEGGFVAWLKQDGDPIKPGDPLFTLEGDKAAQDIEALDAGTLRLGPDSPEPGDRVSVGQVIAHLVAEGVAEPIPAAPPRGPTASPRARRAARQVGIDWRPLTGTGRQGRVRERDVLAAGPRAGKPPGGRLVPHTALRRAIAERMLAGSCQTAPVTLHARADASNLANLRRQFKAAGGEAPSYTDLLIKLTATALREHPLLQAQWHQEGLFVPDRIDIAFAVDTEAGLFAPVVRGADAPGLRETAARSRDLIDRARAGRLSEEHLREPTFTITNLGAHGVDGFTPIITPPQCAVLGLGAITREPVAAGDRVIVREVLTLSLTFDHRVIDGAPAARFLAAVRQRVEQPAPFLVG